MKNSEQIFKATKVRLYPTASKLERLKGTIADFQEALKAAIDCYWKMEKVSGFYPPKELKLKGRIGSDASVLAWQIVKGAKKKRKASKPEVKNHILVLNEFSGRITGFQTKKFDLWFSVINSRNKCHRILIPSKKTQHLNRFLLEGYQLRKDIKIKLKGEKVFAYLTLIKETPPKKEGEVIGADIGYRKLITLSNGQSFGKEIKELIERYYKRNIRCPRTIKHHINRILKALPWERIGTLVIEKLRNLKKGKKGRWSKEINRRFNSWLYGWTIRRLRELCQENGVFLAEVSSRDTSRRCPACLEVEPGNRNGDVFRCLKCGYTQDADYVGALNILHRFLFPTAGFVAVPKVGNICL